MDWSSLPNELQEKILSCLPASSIPQCKQVCKSWKDFIETRLNKNMFGEVPKYVKTVETIRLRDLGVLEKRRSGFCVKALFENNLVLSCDDRYNRKNYIHLLVFNVVTKDSWKVGNIGPLEKNMFEKDIYVYINKTLLAICYRSDNKQLDSEHKVLKVYSLEAKEIIFEEILLDRLRKVEIDQSSSMIALLYSTKIEILSFNDNLFSRFSCKTQIPINFDTCVTNFQTDDMYDDKITCLESATYLNFPFLCHCEVNDVNEYDEDNGVNEGTNDREDLSIQTSAFVWKINDQKKQVRRHKYVADFGSCLQLTTDSIALMEAIYVSSSFVVILEETPSFHDTGVFLFWLKILNDEGDLVKTIPLKDHSFDSFGAYLYENRLVINSFELGGKGEMNVFDLGELLNSEANNNVTMKRFPELNHQHSEPLSNHSSIASIECAGMGKIHVLRLDFWAIE